MNVLEQKLASLLPQELLALLEKIESIEGAENDYSIANYINNTPLTKFERFMLVRAYRRYESRRARFQAMELLFPVREDSSMYRYESFKTMDLDLATAKMEGAPVIMRNPVSKKAIHRSRVGHI